MRPIAHSGQGVAVAIEGFAAAGWFSWSGAHPAGWARAALVAGSVIGVALVVLGVGLARRGRGGDNPLGDPRAFHRYLVIFWGEVVGLVVVAIVLSRGGHGRWVPVAVCAGVGVHFLPLAAVVRQRGLLVSGLALVAVAGLALVVAAAGSTDPASVTGPGAGLVLIGTAAATALGYGVDRPPPATV